VSGTGLTPAEEHLGDRLAAFVDGELLDDARDRVLAHLVTCPCCKAAADDQRRLKSAISASAAPAISAGLLARLQGLPGLTNDDDNNGPGLFDGSGEAVEAPTLGGERLDGGRFGNQGADFGLPALTPPSRGFRIHQVPRAASPDQSRSASSRPSGSPAAASRGRRFAFAAAGAFSMAALALGAALPLEGAAAPGTDDPGPAVTPLSVDGSEVADVRLQSGGALQPQPDAGLSPVSGIRPLVVPHGRPLATSYPAGSSPAVSAPAPRPSAAAAPSASPSPLPPGSVSPSAGWLQPDAPASPSLSLPVRSVLPLLGTPPVSP
jgi:hypothetical protein